MCDAGKKNTKEYHRNAIWMLNLFLFVNMCNFNGKINLLRDKIHFRSHDEF